MIYYDVFNGDADGICALQQLRLKTPQPEAQLITGVKRDIALIKRVDAKANDTITVLDISFDKNRAALLPLLDSGVKIQYFDHHFAGEIPQHEKLETHINTQSDTCTSLIVNQFLENSHWRWAAVGAFGDNFDKSAQALILKHEPNFDESKIALLKNLGIFINYNAYGESLSDLHITPIDLFQALHSYEDPIEFIENHDAYKALENGYNEDMNKAASLNPEVATASHALFMLPAETWARRVSGVFANQLAQANPGRAHALLTRRDADSYVVSVRAPLTTKEGADELCRQFDTGGGRKAAAGINILPDSAVDTFISAFKTAFP